MTAKFLARPAPNTTKRVYVRPHTPDYKGVHRIADAAMPLLRRDLLAALKTLRAEHDPVGTPSTTHMEPIKTALLAGYAATVGPAGSYALANLPPSTRLSQAAEQPTADISFNLLNPNAQAWMQDHAADLVTNVSDNVRESIATITQQATAGKYTVAQSKALIAQVIGLSPRDAGAVGNYFAAQVDSDVPETKALATAATYSDKLLSRRADTIARSEVMRGANQGLQLGWEQAQQSGLLPMEAEKVWVTTPDDRLCDICEELDGEAVAMDDSFSDGEDQPPDHASCRCCTGIQQSSIGLGDT